MSGGDGGADGGADGARRPRERRDVKAVSTSPIAGRTPRRNGDRKKSASRRGF